MLLLGFLEENKSPLSSSLNTTGFKFEYASRYDLPKDALQQQGI